MFMWYVTSHAWGFSDVRCHVSCCLSPVTCCMSPHKSPQPRTLLCISRHLVCEDSNINLDCFEPQWHGVRPVSTYRHNTLFQLGGLQESVYKEKVNVYRTFTGPLTKKYLITFGWFLIRKAGNWVWSVCSLA